MNLSKTSPTLIRDARTSDPDAWRRLVSIYGPFLYSRLRRKGVAQEDAADIVQDTFLATSKSISQFNLGTGRTSFRSWIWVVARNKMLDHIKRRCHRIQAAGGSDAQIQMLQVVFQENDLDKQETDSSSDCALLVNRIREMIRNEFAPTTYQAFLLTTVDDKTGLEVAEELGMTVGAVYKAKSRVLARVRSLVDNPLQSVSSDFS